MDEPRVDPHYTDLDRLLSALGDGVADRTRRSGPAFPAAGTRRTATNWRKRLRGTIGVGLTWAVGWGLAGGLMWLVITAAAHGLDSLGIAMFLGWQYAVVGFLGGVAFSALLRFAEGRRRFDQLRAGRLAIWGAVGGLLIGGAYAGALMALFGDPLDAAIASFLAVTTVFGAGSAAGSLAVARLADDASRLERGPRTTRIVASPDGRRTLPSKTEQAED